MLYLFVNHQYFMLYLSKGSVNSSLLNAVIAYRSIESSNVLCGICLWEQ